MSLLIRKIALVGQSELLSCLDQKHLSAAPMELALKILVIGQFLSSGRMRVLITSSFALLSTTLLPPINNGIWMVLTGSKARIRSEIGRVLEAVAFLNLSSYSVSRWHRKKTGISTMKPGT